MVHVLSSRLRECKWSLLLLTYAWNQLLTDAFCNISVGNVKIRSVKCRFLLCPAQRPTGLPRGRRGRDRGLREVEGRGAGAVAGAVMKGTACISCLPRECIYRYLSCQEWSFSNPVACVHSLSCWGRQFAEGACGSVPAFTDPAALCARFSRPGAVRRALLAAARPGRAAAGPRGEGRAAAQPGRRRGRGGDPLRHGLPRGRGQGRGRQVRARAGPGGPATPRCRAEVAPPRVRKEPEKSHLSDCVPAEPETARLSASACSASPYRSWLYRRGKCSPGFRSGVN